MNKRIYERATLDVIVLQHTDIIATSGWTMEDNQSPIELPKDIF